MKRRTTIIIMLALCCCTEPVEVEFGSNQNYLVIDGFITNEPGPHKISITETVPFKNDDGKNLPKIVSGAIVSIADNVGNVEPLTEVEGGVYLTSDPFRGIVGRSYTLVVNILGELYESTPQFIPEPSQVDSTYYVTDVLQSITELGNVFEKERVTFYADVTFNSDTVFSALSWNGTFEWRAILSPDTRTRCFVNEEDIGFSHLLNPKNVGLSSKGLQVDELINGDRFTVRYSFNTLLFTFGEEAYDYLRKVDDQVNSTGSVFDPLPFQINGNIKALNNDNRTVLGFFGAYGVNSHRISASHQDLDVPVISCTGGLGLGLPPPQCVDCRSYPGATTRKPRYWVD